MQRFALSKVVEHAVIVHFQYGSTDLTRLFALEKQIEAALADAGAGDLDGDEIAVDGSDGFLFMYGPDADRLFEVVVPILWSADFMEGATVKRRYGPAEASSREFTETLSKRVKS